MRTRKARKWARLTLAGLVVLSMSAVWQERALSPKLHDGMVVTAAYTWELIEADGASSYLTAMTNFQGNGNRSEHNAITQALLKLRQ